MAFWRFGVFILLITLFSCNGGTMESKGVVMSVEVYSGNTLCRVRFANYKSVDLFNELYFICPADTKAKSIVKLSYE